MRIKNICQYCHFLSKETREENTGRTHSFSLPSEERVDLDKVPTHYSVKCWMGVWDEGVAPHPIDRRDTISKVNRRGRCFFWPHRPSMLFKAAEILQKREHEYEQMKRSNLYTRIGLWIAAIGLFVGAVVKFLLPS